MAAGHDHQANLKVLSNAINSAGVRSFDDADDPGSSNAALALFKIAAELGSVDARFNVACCYFNGRGATVRPESGIKWATVAARLDQLDALYVLGMCYYLGHGTGNDLGKEEREAVQLERDHANAVAYLKRAARRRHPAAQNLLGHCYRLGHGVKQDTKKAFKCFQKAAAQGNMDAEFNLASSYYHGVGTSKSLDDAELWCQRAARHGHKDAEESLMALTGREHH
ncbi:uncharacterized protein BJ171DRAFT_442537 [Polychytrium aggregatum]|uniref:uncharacterized protein n=1 Tax=Polychytrium aggregatum TaxID=110093 RepID=UPI0022FEDAE7|nr:uncharacterized protein BJ171DRAFT_442537 [Polychytrium aggregatum]KAI9204480.1 hypothetical protein BJ171DRAFT_442537 [Polychytrium aggregatum]